MSPRAPVATWWDGVVLPTPATAARRRGRLLVAASLASLVVLAGCSGSDAPEAPDPTTTANGDLPEGRPAPELLSSVRCNPDGDGVWAAVGSVKNPTENPVDYQVSAQVGAADGDVAATTRQLVDVAAGATVRFRLDAIPTSSPDGPCHVQLLVLP